MRIALYGGSFDPVHFAHLKVAKTALKKKLAAEVWFIPTYQNPWKETSGASFEKRVEMLNIACKPYRHMKVCEIESMWDDTSYTIRTVKELKKRYPEHEFVYLIGTDQAKSIEKWKDIEELSKLVTFYVFAREDVKVESKIALQFVKMDILEMSSTEIKKGRVSAIPNAVRHYIGKEGLYLENWVKQLMGEKRFTHSLSVANLAKEIACSHHLDEEKAWLCGLLHDVCKEMPYEKAKRWMEIYHPEHMSQASAIWHGYLGAHYVEQYFMVEDPEILSAIYHHVLGNGVGVYDMILYVSDKLDPLRPYDSSETIALCKKDLKQGFEEVKNQQQAYLKKEKVIA